MLDIHVKKQLGHQIVTACQPQHGERIGEPQAAATEPPPQARMDVSAYLHRTQRGLPFAAKDPGRWWPQHSLNKASPPYSCPRAPSATQPLQTLGTGVHRAMAEPGALNCLAKFPDAHLDSPTTAVQHQRSGFRH